MGWGKWCGKGVEFVEMCGCGVGLVAGTAMEGTVDNKCG